jgi:putative membrane protein
MAEKNSGIKKYGNILKRLAKGLFIGSAMLVPGVSGGTMAIILGIYDELIHAVNSIRRDVKTHGLLLGEYAIGGLVGILLFSGPILAALDRWNKPMQSLFMGAILASIPPLYRKVRVSKIRLSNAICALFGAAVAVSTRFLPSDMISIDSGFNLLNFALLTVAGFVVAVALVLPGISGSYILLMMGMYDVTLLALKTFNAAYLTPLVIGCFAGVFLTTKTLEHQMERHPQFTYMLIIGFMLGSVVQMFPGIPGGIEILACVATFAAGFAAVWYSGRFA